MPAIRTAPDYTLLTDRLLASTWSALEAALYPLEYLGGDTDMPELVSHIRDAQKIIEAEMTRRGLPVPGGAR